MIVTIIGAGNVANVLGKKIKNAGHTIAQIYNHNYDNAQELANELKCKDFTDSLKLINKTSDIYIIAVKDSAISNVNNFLQLDDKLVVHTAGSVGKDALEKISFRYGVLYPLQSLRAGMNALTEIPFLIDGKDDTVTKLIKDFADTISGSVQMANDAERLKLHVAAVMVSNFSNHLYVMANDYCKAEHLNFDLLKPLIEETAMRLRQFEPRNVQTGPALRNDIITLDKHLRVLAPYPRLRYIYLKMTDSIINLDN